MAVCREQQEAQTGAVSCQELHVALLKGKVAQDHRDLKDPLAFDVVDAELPGRVEQGLPNPVSWRAFYKEKHNGT